MTVSSIVAIPLLWLGCLIVGCRVADVHRDAGLSIIAVGYGAVAWGLWELLR
jgi:hypothetical protein